MKQRYIKLNNKLNTKIISISSIYNATENRIYNYIDKWFKKQFDMQFNHYALFEKDCVIFTKEQIEALNLKQYLSVTAFKKDKSTLRNLERFRPKKTDQFISNLNSDWSAFLTEQCLNDNFLDPLLDNNDYLDKYFDDYFDNKILPKIIKSLIPPIDWSHQHRQKPKIFEIYNIDNNLYVSIEPKFKTIPAYIIDEEHTKNEFKKIINNVEPIYSEKE